MNADVSFLVESITQNIGAMISANVSVMNQQNIVCQENYACNPSIWACECDKYCDICEYLEDCTSIKSLVNDLVVTFDEIADTPETTWFNRNDKTNFWLIAVVLLAIA